jgi:hypothetical protein
MSFRGNFPGEYFQRSNQAVGTEEMERLEFTTLPRLPAILTDAQTGWLLGFTTEGVGTLVREKRLKPLGEAGPDDAKRFATAYILNLATDRQWLDDATNTIYKSRNKK